MRSHLFECDKYINKQKDTGRENAITRYADAVQHPKLIIPKLTSAQKHALDLRFSKACYTAALPFTIYNGADMREAFHMLNPAYKPPERHIIAGELLDEVYTNLKETVDKAIHATQMLNIVTDESTDINRTRISNISVNTPSGALYWYSDDIGSKQMTAINIVDWLKGHLFRLCHGDFNKINSIATDTCNTMLLVWELFQALPEFKHCFFVPCDSHGIQLLIKDLLALPCFKEVHDQAQTVVRSFKTAPLQLARLREIQLQKYNEPRALCLSVITRWGSQYRLVYSLLNSKEALRQYAFDHHDNGLPDVVVSTLLSRPFWEGLERLREVLEPITEHIKMSESDKSHLGRVMDRWDQIHIHLTRMQPDFPGLDAFLSPQATGTGFFYPRFKRQVLPIHAVACFLTPSNRTVPLDAATERDIFSFFEKYTNSPQDAATAFHEFHAFRNMLEPFDALRLCWKAEADPRMFWLYQMTHTKVLANLAYRLFSTPANSVPSERSFSIMNLIHTKLRKNLRPVKVNKLTFIYINDRVLRRINKEPVPEGKGSFEYDPSPQEEVHIEDEWMEDNDEGQSDENLDSDDLESAMSDMDAERVENV